MFLSSFRISLILESPSRVGLTSTGHYWSHYLCLDLSIDLQLRAKARTSRPAEGDRVTTNQVHEVRRKEIAILVGSFFRQTSNSRASPSMIRLGKRA